MGFLAHPEVYIEISIWANYKNSLRNKVLLKKKWHSTWKSQTRGETSTPEMTCSQKYPLYEDTQVAYHLFSSHHYLHICFQCLQDETADSFSGTMNDKGE